HRDAIKAAALFSSIGEGVIVSNEYGRIEQCNELTKSILGYTDREMLGKRFTEVIRTVNEDGSPIEPLDRPIMRTFITGLPVSERTYYLTKSGNRVPVDINISPVIVNGAPIGAIEVFSDLSDEYMKDKIQSEFISIASHQLRTPLSSINTYAQMLSGGYAGKMTNRQTNFVSVIESSAAHMNELIHSLLNVTRIEAGNISVNVKPVDIDEVCRDLVRTILPQAKEKNIAIKYINDGSPTVETDPILLREILSNLVSNAIKYTPERGKVVFKVETRERIVFSIKDNGFGIPDRSKDYVFSKFYRAKNASDYDVSGTGLGLYLAKRITERLEGDIWFSSHIGKGSTFYFSLPLGGSTKKQGRFTLEAPS
ncbi:MAG TPA: PAS domain-containing sensor histidine kinase, partial [Candidatus Saccharimonadales bacterium]